MQDETKRAIDFAPLTSSNLGRLQQENDQEENKRVEGLPQGSPAYSPRRMAQQTLALLDEVQLVTS